jgi:hypothetical protein
VLVGQTLLCPGLKSSDALHFIVRRIGAHILKDGTVLNFSATQSVKAESSKR